jgi:hypothetical protein
MKIEELRIGNYVTIIPHKENDVIKIDCENFKNLLEFKTFDRLNPIPLTEEWLLKLGFEMKGFYRLKVTSFLELCWKPHNKTLNIQTIKNGFTEDSKVRYVHEFQNLYFALNKKEIV